MIQQIVGYDPGTANLGRALLSYDGKRCTDLRTEVFRSRPVAGLVATTRRITDLVRRAVPAGERTTCSECQRVDTEPPTHVVLAVVEVPVPASGAAYHGELTALIDHLVRLLDKRKIPVATTYPGTLKKFATGMGNATKAEMKMALDRTWPGVMTRSEHDRADAEHQVDASHAALAGGTFLDWHDPDEPLRVLGVNPASIRQMTWPKLPAQRQVPAVAT